MNSGDITIRVAWIADLEALTELLGRLFEIERDFQPDAARQREGLKQLLLEPGSVILAAERGSKIIGMCTVQTVISTAEGGPAGLLEDMIVDSRFRRQGIGRALLSTAEKWAAEKGLTRLQLLAEANNEAALEFYSMMGWQGTGLICRRKKLSL